MVLLGVAISFFYAFASIKHCLRFRAIKAPFAIKSKVFFTQ
jgi:hypothetical protein